MELDAITALIGAGGITMGSLLTYFGVRRRADGDHAASFRGDLLARVATLETRLDAERRDCREQLRELRGELDQERQRCDEALANLRDEMRQETNDKLRRQGAQIRAEYRRDLEEHSESM